MVLFLIAEVMFFAALVSAYIVLRKGAPEWPPRGLPPLARGLSVSNTVLLCLSAGSMLLSTRAVRRDDPDGLKLYLGITMALGMTFLGVQAYELLRLAGIIPVGEKLFRSVFYTVAGLHGVHVAGGVALLGLVLWRAFRGRYNPYRSAGVTISSLYWYFVVVVWVFLFFALYVV
jgi:cytochrome c oxidase subunit 3